MIKVGSSIIQEHLKRIPKDIDIIGTYEDYKKFVSVLKYDVLKHYPINENKNVIFTKRGKIYEWEISWEGSTGESLIKIVEDQGENLSKLDLSYTLKMSHRYLKNNPHFLKTMSDIKLLRDLGATIPECLKEWFIIREKETYDYRHPKLNKTKGEFFNGDGVTYYYDHDSLHQAVKLFNKPAYEYYKPNTNEVFCSEELFNNCSEEIKLAGVFEESCVLALERCLIPFDWNIKQNKAFIMALEKVCTSITSGWFREFAWENYDKVLDLYKDKDLKSYEHRGYLKESFENGLREIIRPYEDNQ